MKKHLSALILACLMLCGCGAERPAEETTDPIAETEAAAAPTTAPVGLYDAGSAPELRYGGALRTYPLNLPDTLGMHALGEDLLVLSGREATTLTRLSGEDLHIAASTQLAFSLSPEDASLRITGGGISYYDPDARQTVVLDGSLKEIRHIAAPEDLVGAPILSADRNTLYYCTGSAIRAWDLETGIRRVLKEITQAQSVTGLHMEDTVLQCRVLDGGRERTLFLSTEDGRTLYDRNGSMTLRTLEDRYYASFPTGAVQALLFGQGGDEPLALLPGDITARCFFLETNHAAVTSSVLSDNEIQLDYYDLETGLRCSTLTLDAPSHPAAVQAAPDGSVYVLAYSTDYASDTIYRWNVNALPLSEDTDYTGTYYTAAEPDADGIAQCQAYAAEIGSKYGIEVLIWEDALALQPWDYDLEAEYLVPVLQRELALLDARLGQFPEGFLEDTLSHFTGLKIGLVRSLTGTAESGSVDTAAGVQFFEGTDACIVLAVGETSEKALYHELYHVMETHILNESIAFDQWERLNPEGFAYDYDYQANAQRDGSAYLQEETRSFIDTYSMSFPKEDRARILEYAMTPGNEAFFRSPYMQAKLMQLCSGIREAYGLKKSEETFLWEQYLYK